MDKWFKIFSTKSFAEANIVKGMLEENGVTVVVLNKQDSSYINFGEVELHVPAHLQDIAEDLLKKST